MKPILSWHDLDVFEMRSRHIDTLLLFCSKYSVEATTSEVVCYDHISHSVKDKLDVLRVSSTGHVTVDLFCCRFVLGLKLSLNISGSLTILLGARVFRETNC